MRAARKAERPRARLHNAILALAAVVGLAIGAGVYYLIEWRWLEPTLAVEPVRDATAAVADLPGQRPAFSLLDTDGVAQAVSQWDGKLLVLNFWATWCAPCLHEIPIFIDLQHEYQTQGLQFVGIAIDHPDRVREFSSEIGMNYPTLHGQADAIEVGKLYGNTIGGLPYTVVIARDRRIVLVKSGPFEREEIEQAIRRYL